MLFNPSRDQVRQFFCDAWQKHLQALPQTPLEVMAIDWMIEHPEYHALLSQGPQAHQQDYSVEQGQTNPFLHLSMHLAIAEQLSIDQPSGIKAAFASLAQHHDSLHKASHEVMECLGLVMHQAQQTRSTPDTDQYIDCIKRRASKR
jgi:Domain of unknown function (DUF1841)